MNDIFKSMKNSLKPGDAVKEQLFVKIETSQEIAKHSTVIKHPWLPATVAAGVMIAAIAVAFPIFSRNSVTMDYGDDTRETQTAVMTREPTEPTESSDPPAVSEPGAYPPVVIPVPATNSAPQTGESGFSTEQVTNSEPGSEPATSASGSVIAVPPSRYGNTQGNLVNYGRAVAYGDKIYFAHGGIYSMNLDRSNIQLIPGTYGIDGSINIVGGRIYFGEVYQNGIYTDVRLVSTDLNGNDRKALTTGNIIGWFCVAGDDIFFLNEAGGISTVKTDGSGERKLNPQKDGFQHIGYTSHLFVAGDRIYWSNGSMKTDGTDYIEYGNPFDFSSSFTTYEDGTVVYGVNNQVYIHGVFNDRIYYKHGERLYTMNIDGSDRRRHSDQMMGYINITEDKIYFTEVSAPVNGIDRSTNHLYVMNHDGSNKRRLSSRRVSAPSIAGDWIFFTSSRRYTVKIDGTGERRIDVPWESYQP
jgi:hypothetical protein